MTPGVSVIICCYNSAERLMETIKHIAFQKIPDSILWEVIIVDNASTDNTVRLAAAEWKKYNLLHINFRVITEPKQGLTNARNRGVEESKYEYILFCDDDNWLHCDYVSKAFSIINGNNSIGVLGGRSEAVSDHAFPFWFSTFQASYAVGVQAINSGDVSSRRYVWGAGMVLRKSVYQKLAASGFKHYLSDRSGKQLMSGGDSEICAWYLLVGLKLWYSEDLMLKHFMPPERLAKDYFEKMLAGLRDSALIHNKYFHLIRIFQNEFYSEEAPGIKTS